MKPAALALYQKKLLYKKRLKESFLKKAVNNYIGGIDVNFFSGLVNALPGAVAQGLIWGLMAIGVYITYKVLDLADLTVDGTMATGGALCIVLMTNGVNIWIALLCSFLVGLAAGAITGILHTFMGIPAILAGILTQLSLFSINLRIMGGKANVAINPDKYRLLVSLRHDYNRAVVLVFRYGIRFRYPRYRGESKYEPSARH